MNHWACWWTQQLLHLVGLSLSNRTGTLAEHEVKDFQLPLSDTHIAWTTELLPLPLNQWIGCIHNRGTDLICILLAFSAGWLLIDFLVILTCSLPGELLQQRTCGPLPIVLCGCDYLAYSAGWLLTYLRIFTLVLQNYFSQTTTRAVLAYSVGWLLDYKVSTTDSLSSWGFDIVHVGL